MSGNIQFKTLEYHKKNPSGKLEIKVSKPLQNSNDLSLAYTPGVAFPCEAIAKNKELVWDYTAKNHLIAIITDGSAVLGLGNIGPEAAKPVMEGKVALLKFLANIDAFDLEIKSRSTNHFIEIVQSLEPTFGGINLEDIRSPECFRIEQELQQSMNIPVFHDDQHGTATVIVAAALNAAELIGKKLQNMRIVFNGCGASAIATAKLLLEFNCSQEALFMCDTQGLVIRSRPNLPIHKQEFAHSGVSKTLSQVLPGADLFIGLSAGNVLTAHDIDSMNNNPIVFALANPHPEISRNELQKCKQLNNMIVATGRSDYPNQVNNALCFPYMFRAALDTRAREINPQMKVAATQAIANLAKKHTQFGKNRIIPKPLDTNLATTVSVAIAQAACSSGVARFPITDFKQYVQTISDKLTTKKIIPSL